MAHLASGNAASVAIGMVTLAVMAHMLGPALLGILAMVEAYGRLIDQIIRLESWQAIIRYGAAAIEAGDRRRFLNLIQFGVALDVMGALAAGSVALLAVPLAGEWLRWSAETQSMAQIYSIAVAFGISSTPIGILRLFDRFAAIAWLEPILALLRLAAVACIWAIGGSIWEMLVIAVVTPSLQRVILTIMAWRELRRRGYHFVPHISGLAKAREFAGIWTFIVSANGAVLIRKSTQELDILAVGAVAGPAGAGLYQLVRKITLTAMKAGAMLQQVAFPDLARLWVRRELDEFATIIRQIELLTLSIGIIFVLGVVAAGDDIIRLIAGSAFEDGGPPLIVQSVAALLFLAGSAIRPALMTMGMQSQVLWVAFAAGAGFYTTLYFATPRLGVSGAGAAHIMFNLIWLPSCLILFATALRRARASRPADHHSPGRD